ncbi:ribosomal subunit interface protein [archaeon]|nr:ribosomal subunit interface protein [archaeon]|tara:strand:+ start:436 stop:810 length:375 start_codon:yes stop_codon:yes gene_type:complete
MKISIKSTNYKLEDEVRKYATEKVNSLDKFIIGMDPEVVNAWVELGQTTNHHKQGGVLRAEVQFHLPGKSIRAEATTDNIFHAINEVTDELKRELRKYKTKQVDKKRKQGRNLKEMLVNIFNRD